MINAYISSSNIDRVGWAKNVLYVEFNSGTIYAYKAAPFKAYLDLIAAESVGQHFHRHIRNVYEYVKIDYNPFVTKSKGGNEFTFGPSIETKRKIILSKIGV